MRQKINQCLNLIWEHMKCIYLSSMLISTADSTAALQCPFLPQREAYCHPESRTHWTPEIIIIIINIIIIIIIIIIIMYLAAVPSVGVSQGPWL